MCIVIIILLVLCTVGILYLALSCGKESFNDSCVGKCNREWLACNKENKNNCGQIHDECLKSCS